LIRDPGLQPERTAMAWSRTAMGVAVNALLILRAGFQEHDWPLTFVGLLLSTFGIAVAVMGTQRHTQLSRGMLACPGAAAIGAVSAAMVLAAASGCWLMLR